MPNDTPIAGQNRPGEDRTDDDRAARPAADDLYGDDLLARALDPACQPAAIRAFLAEESTRLARLTPQGARVVDFGCGYGRHLLALAARLGPSLGIDRAPHHIIRAKAERATSSLQFLVADATAVPCSASFDFAICMTNTWGTMEARAAVLHEMRRLSPAPRSRILSVYSPSSIEPRRAWYGQLGQEVIEETDHFLRTSGGFVTEHFTPQRLRALVGDCEIVATGAVGYWVRL